MTESVDSERDRYVGRVTGSTSKVGSLCSLDVDLDVMEAHR
jgi:hypothetical protein